MSDPVVAHGDGRGIPSDGDAGGSGFENFQVCRSIGNWRKSIKTAQVKRSNTISAPYDENDVSFHTGLLMAAKRQALLCPADGVNVNQVIGIGSQSCQGEVVSGRG